MRVCGPLAQSGCEASGEAIGAAIPEGESEAPLKSVGPSTQRSSEPGKWTQLRNCAISGLRLSGDEIQVLTKQQGAEPRKWSPLLNLPFDFVANTAGASLPRSGRRSDGVKALKSISTNTGERAAKVDTFFQQSRFAPHAPMANEGGDLSH